MIFAQKNNLSSSLCPAAILNPNFNKMMFAQKINLSSSLCPAAILNPNFASQKREYREEALFVNYY
jgi:hypothetical protein